MEKLISMELQVTYYSVGNRLVAAAASALMKAARPKPTLPAVPDMVSMKRNTKDFCPVRDVLDRVGDQWSVLILFPLVERVMRFGELKKHISDVSARVLTQTLRRLE